MKRTAEEDNDELESYSSHMPKLPKSSHFIPPAFQPREPPPPLPSAPQHQPQPGLLNESLISQLLNKAQPVERYTLDCIPLSPTSLSPPRRPSPAKPSLAISWSAWDGNKSDDESENPTSNENQLTDLPPTKQTYNWHSLVTSAGAATQTDRGAKPTETLPKFAFDDSCFDEMFNDLDE